jgi:hypothetical protein
MYDLQSSFISYMVGFFQTDGHHRSGKGNKGSITLEIGYKDKDIIKKISSLLDVNYSITERERITNFTNGVKKKYITLRICGLPFRQWIKKYVPTGKKSKIICQPEDPHSEIDYWRGVIDGDGSLGITGGNLPFLGFVTDSDKLAEQYASFLKSITGRDKIIKRNKRDNIYNITIFRESAQEVVKKIYYKNCICLNRKKNKAKEVISWKRPKNIKKRAYRRKWWSKEEDEFVLSHSIDESMEKLSRTRKSVGIRLYRLNKK